MTFHFDLPLAGGTASLPLLARVEKNVVQIYFFPHGVCSITNFADTESTKYRVIPVAIYAVSRSCALSPPDHSGDHALGSALALREEQNMKLLNLFRNVRSADVQSIAALLDAGQTYLLLRAKTAHVSSFFTVGR